MGTSGVFDSVQVSLGRKEQACPLLSPPVFLPCFPANSTSIPYDAAVGASLLLIFELGLRMSNSWFVRCNGKGVLPSQKGREMISPEVLFAVNCPLTAFLLTPSSCS